MILDEEEAVLVGGVTAAGERVRYAGEGFRSTFLQTTGRPSATASVALPRVIRERENYPRFPVAPTRSERSER
jgi:hypothetical protein